MIVKDLDTRDYYQLNWLESIMLGHKGFIAGGCFKNIFNKEKVRDVDLFFRSIQDWEEACDWFDKRSVGYTESHSYTITPMEDKHEEEYQFYYQNSNVKAYKRLSDGLVIELTNKVHGSPEDVLNMFDFTISKFALYAVEVEDDTDAIFEELFGEDTTKIETHIEYRVMMDDKFFEHLHLKRLVTDNKILYPASTFNRMLKYARYGYFPCRETKMKIMSAINQMNSIDIKVSESMYDGMD